MYLLDTNIISYWMRGDRRVIDRIKKHSPSDLSLSSITLAEILYGIEKSPMKKKERRLKISRYRRCWACILLMKQRPGNMPSYEHNLKEKVWRSVKGIPR